MIEGTMMNKSTKGALAAAAAGSLLLGGAGSLAYWTDAESITGGTIKAGHLKLTPVGAGCEDWKLSGTAFDVASDKVVPGDTLTRHCEYTVTMSGKSLAAEVNVGTPSFTGTLEPGLSHTATYSVGTVTDVPTGTATVITNGQTVAVDLEVEFPHVADAGAGENNRFNKSTTLTAILSDFTVTATQVDPTVV
jgi:alternate signal-mediated exported protein